MMLLTIHKSVAVRCVFFFPIIKLGFAGVAKLANVLARIIGYSTTLLTPGKRKSGNDKSDYEYVSHNIDFRI